jgi:hypothetical protein
MFVVVYWVGHERGSSKFIRNVAKFFQFYITPYSEDFTMYFYDNCNFIFWDREDM